MKTTSKSTKDQILDIAERHFAMYGFAGTSLRGIIKEAKVNVAAVAYHYGSKEELFNAVIQRFAMPVVERQLMLLDEKISFDDLSLRAILLSFYAPPVQLLKSKGAEGETLSMLLGRAQTEPEPVFSMVDKHYAGCRSRYIDAFRRVLPQATDAELHWYFEFMLSLIVCFLTRQAPIRKRYGETDDWSAEEAIARMVNFCESGMRSE